MHVKVYVVEVRRSTRGPQVLISRTHPGLVKRLFELEVPEIYDGTVEVKSTPVKPAAAPRWPCGPTTRTWTPSRLRGPQGPACGQHCGGAAGREDRHRQVQRRPGPVYRRRPGACRRGGCVDGGRGKACRVIVPDDQLSLAIGKEGQNARLAARLTGYKIDIKPESYHDEEEPPAGGAPEAADTAEASAVEPVDAE